MEKEKKTELIIFFYKAFVPINNLHCKEIHSYSEVFIGNFSDCKSPRRRQRK